MELQLVKKYDARAWDGVVVPLGEGNLNSYQGPWERELAAVRASGRFEGKTGEIFRFSVLSEGVLTQFFLLGLGKDWSLEQVLEATKGLPFKPCVTDYDKYVAFNAAYADLCKTLTPDLIIETGHAFFFEDEDAPCNKIWIYMESFE